MDVLTEESVRLGAQASDKVDAIRQSGELLVQAGCVPPAYIEGMLAREDVMSTYLGNGVAIPHGRFEDLKTVQRAGVSVLQLPDGVEWEPGERAYLIIGLAATSDEHMGVLTNLVEVVQHREIVEQLAHTTDPTVIVERLTRGAEIRSS
jgi:phosphocarrier protein FPr